MRARSVALRPYSPNATKLPRCALPAILPLNCLRNLVRFGCIMCRYLIQLGRGCCGLRGFLYFRLGLGGLRRGLLEHLALEDPYLDADDAVGGLRFREAIIDVGAEGMQRHAALAIRFGARNLGAV